MSRGFQPDARGGVVAFTFVLFMRTCGGVCATEGAADAAAEHAAEEGAGGRRPHRRVLQLPARRRSLRATEAVLEI